MARPIRSSTQIWVVTRHQHGISAFVSQMSFRGETSGGVAKCRLFSQARLRLICLEGELVADVTALFPNSNVRDSIATYNS